MSYSELSKDTGEGDCTGSKRGQTYSAFSSRDKVYLRPLQVSHHCSEAPLKTDTRDAREACSGACSPPPPGIEGLSHGKLLQ